MDSKKTNRYSRKFLRGLIAAFGGKATEDQISLYEDKLGKWFLNEREWDRSLDQIIADLENRHGLPELAIIYRYLKAAKIENKEQSDPNFQLFTLNGIRYARPIRDLIAPPMYPAGCEDPHISVANPIYNYEERVSGQEARQIFAIGFMKAGGKPELIDEMYKAVIKKDKYDTYK